MYLTMTMMMMMRMKWILIHSNRRDNYDYL
jgi:hypothetical protein